MKVEHAGPALLILSTLVMLSIWSYGGQARTGTVRDVGDDGAAEYGLECRERVGDVPSFDCMTGTVALITVNGKVPDVYEPFMRCDRPVLLPPSPGEKTDGQCVPYSRALVFRDDAEVQISAFYRKKLLHPKDSPLFDEIDVILHSVTDGTTCWFQAKADNPRGDPKIGLDGRRVPSPTMGEPPPTLQPKHSGAFRPRRLRKSAVNATTAIPSITAPSLARPGSCPRTPSGSIETT